MMQRRKRVIVGIILLSSGLIIGLIVFYKPKNLSSLQITNLKKSAAQCVASQLNTFNDYSEELGPEYNYLKIDSIEDLEISGPILCATKMENGDIATTGLLWVISRNNKLVAVVDQDIYALSILSNFGFSINQSMYQMNIPLLEEMHTRGLPVIKWSVQNASGGEMYLSDGLLGSHAYNNITNIGIRQSDSDFPSASSLITSRLGSEYLDFMANKERVVDLL